VIVDTATARSRAESLMTSTCRIYTAGELVTDPQSGEVTHAELNPVTSPCRVRPNTNVRGTASEIGGAEEISAGYIVSIPFAHEPVPHLLQRVVIESSPDASLIGLSLEVRQVVRGDHITARRLFCEEVA
jgi:hypothetical protein